jgi:hypothetical protein
MVMTETRRPAWVDDELFPFESRFVAIDGHTVHYVFTAAIRDSRAGSGGPMMTRTDG